MTFLLLLACSAGKGAPDSGFPPLTDDSAAQDSAGTDSGPRDTFDTGVGDSASDTGAPADSAGDSATVDTGDPLAWRSALYPEAWTPASTHATGAFLHDFSYAGYRHGEAPPRVTAPAFSVLDRGADPTGVTDSTAAIQATLDAAASAGGGVVRLPAGTYRVDGLLVVRASRVVIQGDGASATFLRFTRADAMSDRGHISFQGTLREGTDLPLAADAASRDTAVRVADASGLAPGDTVHLGWTISDAFTEEHGMTGTWVSFSGQWKPFFRRTVVAVDTSVTPNSVTLDVPVRYPARLRDGASLRRVEGYLSEVGVEDLAVTTVMTWEQAWALDRSHAIVLSGVTDAWVRGVSSYAPPDAPDREGDHLASGGVKVVDSVRVTVTDTHMAEAQNRGGGGNGYLFEIGRSNEVLTTDSTGRAGRHNFIQNWDFGTSGCVWLRTRSDEGRNLLADWDPVGLPAYSEYHHSLAMANLVDQSWASDGWQGVNRQRESSGAGHSATQNVFWNTSGGGYLRSLQFGLGYIVGTERMDVHVDPREWDWNNAGEGTEPQDWLEGEDEGAHLVPASLYEDQRARRLAVTTP